MTAMTAELADADISGQAGHRCACAAGRDSEQVSIPAATPDRRAVRSWQLLVLAAPAVVAVWSGWVGIGRMTGFGIVHPLAAIWDSLRIDSAVTLPVGVEAYAAYALRTWLTRSQQVSRRTRRFAGWSAAASLLLGMAGQVAYHLLGRAGPPGRRGGSPRRCPTYRSSSWEWAALAHLLRADACATGQADPVPEHHPDSYPLSVVGRLIEAEAAARQLAAAGQGVSRRVLRKAGLHGSNVDLGRLAAMIRAGQSARASAGRGAAWQGHRLIAANIVGSG